MGMRDWAILLTAVVAFGFNSIITRMAYRTGVDAFSFSLSALLTSTFFFVIFSLIWQKDRIFKINKSEFLKLFYLGLVATIIGMNLYYIGLNYTTATNASFLNRLQSPFMVLFAFFMLAERISKKQLLALTAMLIGAYLITMKGISFNLQVGDFAVALSGLVLGYANIYFKKELSHLSAGIALLWRFVLSAPLLAAAGYLIFGPSIFSAFSTALPFTIAAAFTYAIYMLGLYHGIDKIGPSPTAIATLAVPLVTLAASFVLLGEQMVLVQYAGAAVILASGYILAKSGN